MSTKFLVEWCEKKSPDWIIATLLEGKQQITEVSINRNDKKTGKVAFEKFDDIMSGTEIEGELWKNQAGKHYLFAPRPQSAPRGGFGGVKVAMAEKAKAIEHSQDRKDNSIQLSSTFRDATLLTTAQMKTGEVWSNDEVMGKWKMWRSWLMEQFGDAGDITETKKPF
jgi:hypothetical protein